MYNEYHDRAHKDGRNDSDFANTPNLYPPQYTSSPAQPEVPQPYNPLLYASKFIDANQLAHQGFDVLSKKVEHYRIISGLKQYFDVDLLYLGKKFFSLFFPYLQKDWGRINTDFSVSPRTDRNALDLYIPVMSFLTYVFVCSLSLGYHHIFSPEALGSMVTKGIGCLLLEVCLLMFMFMVTGYGYRLPFLYLLALCAYKYSHTVAIVILALIFPAIRTLIYFYFTFTYILFQFKKLRFVLAATNEASPKPRAAILLILAICQPLIIYLFVAAPIAPSRQGFLKIFSTRSFF